MKNPVPHRASLLGLRANAGLLCDIAAVVATAAAEVASLRNASRRDDGGKGFGGVDVICSGTSDEACCNTIASDIRSRGKDVVGMVRNCGRGGLIWSD